MTERRMSLLEYSSVPAHRNPHSEEEGQDVTCTLVEGMNTSPAEPTARLRVELLATTLIVLAYVVWLLSMPAFPTQDGPVHLYYTHVLRALFSHTATPYTRFYVVKHILPPYALYYYGLLALSKVSSLLFADRLIVCAYVISFVFGFRYLARAIGPGADSMTLLATLLLLNWPLGMGFVNFCLSLSFVFWAMGLWLRFAGRSAPLPRLGFVALAILAMFTHPVPLLALLGLCALHLGLRLTVKREHPRSRLFLSDLITLAIATLTLGYVKLFTASHPLKQTDVGQPNGSFAKQIWQNVLSYGAEKGVAFFAGPGFELRLYRVLLLAVILVSLALAIRGFLASRERRVWSTADAALAISLAALVLLPFVPHDLNASHFFADRLLLFVWLLPLFAASGSRISSSGVRNGLVVAVLLSQAVVLHLAQIKLRPVANTIAAIDSAPGPVAAPPGALGLALEDTRGAGIPPGLTFDPYLWAIADVFRHDNAVLANTPWLDLAIIPLGGTPALPAGALPPAGLEFPSILRRELTRDDAMRGHLLETVDFIAVDQIFRQPIDALDPLLTSTPNAPAVWTCRIATVRWIRVCDRMRR